MTETFYPFDAGVGSAIGEDQWRKSQLPLGVPGVVHGYSTELVVSASSGMDVHIAPGACTCYGTWYETDSTVTLTMANNATASDRVDYIVVEFDWDNNVATVKPVYGTPGSGVVPELTQGVTGKYQVPIAVVVTRAGQNPGNVLTSDVFPLLDRWHTAPGAVPVGTLVPGVWAETAMPYTMVPAAGQVLLAWQYPKLAAVMPALAVPAPQFGALIGFGILVAPDTRSRVLVAPDDMGVASGLQSTRANRIVTFPPAPGASAGGESLAVADMPDHHHGFDGTGVFVRDDANGTAGFAYSGTPAIRVIYPIKTHDTGGDGAGKRLQPLLTANMALVVA